MRLRRSGRAVLAGIMLGTSALVGTAGPVIAGSSISIPAGYDLFETDPQTTHFTFQAPDTGIPADFFGPGSDPFQGTVKFGGHPFGTFMGQPVGDADTIVRRPNNAMAPGGPVPIEIVGLSLVSMQPITVTYNGGQNPEPWQINVRVSQTTPSQGHIDLGLNANGTGGTFDSQLQVIPHLTFVRLSDLQTSVIDGANLSSQALQKLVVSSSDDPWRKGCVLPALAVSALSTKFCPGLTPGGRKSLITEVGQLVSHGLYAVQPQLEHFRCYTLEPKPFDARRVDLVDQFRSRTANITERAELCNPAQKYGELFQNDRAHLQCYVTTGQSIDRVVVVQNQFGSQQLLVKKPTRLCLPTRKTEGSQDNLPRIRVPIDHFQCYAVQAQTGLQGYNPTDAVNLTDQFGNDEVQLGEVFELCAPVSKNGARIQHRVKHLVCYRIGDIPVNRIVWIRNQFELIRLQTVNSYSLCVPSNKVVVPRD